MGLCLWINDGMIPWAKLCSDENSLQSKDTEVSCVSGVCYLHMAFTSHQWIVSCEHVPNLYIV